MAEIKQCPYCAEDIKVAAIVCKHCGRELPEYESAVKEFLKEGSRHEELNDSINTEDLSEDYQSLAEVIVDAIIAIQDEPIDVEDAYQRILERTSFNIDNNTDAALLEINEKWKDFKYADVPSPSAVGSMTVRLELIRIFESFQDAIEESNTTDETKDLSKYSSDSAQSFLSKLKFGPSISAFKVGLEMGEDSQQERFEDAPANAWDLIANITLQTNSGLEGFFDIPFLSKHENVALKERFDEFVFLIFLKYYRIGFERIKSFSRDDQITLNEIKDIPAAIMPSLPVSIMVSWNSGHFRILVNARKTMSAEEKQRVLAASIPLLVLHQMVTLSPQAQRKYRSLLPKEFSNLETFSTSQSIDATLKSIELKLIHQSDAIVPQFYPKFSMFSSGSAKEDAVISFLFGYQKAVLAELERVLCLSAISSGLKAAGWSNLNHNIYLIELAAKTWWRTTASENDIISNLKNL